MVTQHQGVVLVFATVAALSAGTNYVVGAYLPQVGQRLHLGSLALNVVAAAGNAGVYLSGPLVGALVDKRGSQPVLLLAGVCLLAGYSGLASLYIGGPDGWFALGGLPALALCQVLTGLGSSAAISAALKAASLSFPKASRATAMGIVTSGFGLSAFAYSSLSRAHLIAADDPTAAFLVTLAIGCSLSMFLGAAFVRPALPSSAAPSEQYEPLASSDEEHGPARSRSRSPVPPIPQPTDECSLHSDIVIREDASDWDLREDVRRPSAASSIGDKVVDIEEPGAHDMSGWALLRQVDFWALFAFLGLCSGVGLMLINNLGTLVITLLPPDTPSLQVALAQRQLVSRLSVLNCLGRLTMGASSDFFTHRAGPARFPRVWWLIGVACVFVGSQLLAGRAERVDELAFPTAVVGGAYGMLWGLVPVVCLERFGLSSFSQNNGFLTMAPSIFAAFSNLLFGAVYDSPTTLMSLAAVGIASWISTRRSFRPAHHL